MPNRNELHFLVYKACSSKTVVPPLQVVVKKVVAF